MNNLIQLDYLDKNVRAVRERISAAAENNKRSVDGILLLAAVKYASAEEIDYVHKVLGICDVGENRVNTLLEHYEKTDNEGLRYHFIGTLQKNKVKYIYDKICLLHSLDSLPLAQEIEKRCARDGRSLDCLVEINIANEADKGGVSPSELLAFTDALSEYPHVNVKGFMTMAPAGCTQEEYRRYFGDAVALMRTAWTDVLHREGEPFISMGMSGSLEIAIECGSTCVRVGSDIFRH